jgi:hypothetical protein
MMFSKIDSFFLLRNRPLLKNLKPFKVTPCDKWQLNDEQKQTLSSYKCHKNVCPLNIIHVRHANIHHLVFLASAFEEMRHRGRKRIAILNHTIMISHDFKNSHNDIECDCIGKINFFCTILHAEKDRKSCAS